MKKFVLPILLLTITAAASAMQAPAPAPAQKALLPSLQETTIKTIAANIQTYVNNLLQNKEQPEIPNELAPTIVEELQRLGNNDSQKIINQIINTDALQTIANETIVNSVSLQAYKDKLYCAFGSTDGSVSIYQIKNNENQFTLLQTIKNHRYEVRSINLHIHNNQLYCASSSRDRSIKIYTLGDNEQFNLLQTIHERSAVESVRFESFKNQLYCASQFGSVNIYRLNDENNQFTPFQTITVQSEGKIALKSFNNKLYCSLEQMNNSINIYRLNDENNQFTLLQTINHHQDSSSDAIDLQAFDNQFYLVAGFYNGTIKIYQLNENNQFIPIETINVNPNKVLNSVILQSFNDTLYCVAGSDDNTITIYQFNGTRFIRIQTIKDHKDRVNSVALHSFNNQLYCASGSWDRSVIIYRISTELYPQLIDTLTFQQLLLLMAMHGVDSFDINQYPHLQEPDREIPEKLKPQQKKEAIKQ